MSSKRPIRIDMSISADTSSINPMNEYKDYEESIDEFFTPPPPRTTSSRLLRMMSHGALLIDHTPFSISSHDDLMDEGKTVNVARSLVNSISRKVWHTPETMKDGKRRIHQLLLQYQTEEHKNRKSLFNLVMRGDFHSLQEAIKQLGSKAIDIVNLKDATGSNIIHAAYLYEQYKIGRWLVESFPSLALEPHSGEIRGRFITKLYTDHHINVENKDMMYAGQNIVHMTIVRKNIAETRWLLDFYKWHKDSVQNGLERILLGNANGTFFDKDGDFYCGCYPLHFAACSNDTEIFDLVLSFASSFGLPNDLQFRDQYYSTRDVTMDTNRLGSNVIFMRDRYGNNCLHLCVMHGLEGMYAHIKQRASKIIRKEISLRYADALDEEGDEETDTITIQLDQLPEHEGFKTGYSHIEMTEVEAPANNLNKSYIDWLESITEKKVEERMELVLNSTFHSPLTLCASQTFDKQRRDYKMKEEKKKHMIMFLLSQMKKELWTYGPVKTSLVALEGLEHSYYPEKYQSLPPHAHQKMHGVIEWICISNSVRSAEIPEIQKIITAKWIHFGYKSFLWEFIFRIFLTLLMTALLCLSNSLPEKGVQVQSGVVGIVSFLYPLILVLIIGITIYELPLLYTYGLGYWGHKRRIRGASNYEKKTNTIMVLSYFSLFINVYYSVTHSTTSESPSFAPSSQPSLEPTISPTFGASLSNPFSENNVNLGIKLSFCICIISAWLYLLYFFMGFDSTGPFVFTLYRIVSLDIPFFVTFYLIVLIAFACALSTLSSNGNTDASYGFEHLLLTIYDLVQVTVSMQQNGNYNSEIDVNVVPTNVYWLFSVMFTLFYIIVVLMFLNLLIAMINNTYTVYKEFDVATFSMEKYNIMSTMHRTQSFWFYNYRDVPKFYAVLSHDTVIIPVKPAYDANFADVSERNLLKSPMYQTVDTSKVPQYTFEMVDENLAWRGADGYKTTTGTGSRVGGDKVDSVISKLTEALSSISNETKLKINNNQNMPQVIANDLTDAAAGISKRKVTLFIIMPQNDFHEGVGVEGDLDYVPRGSLAVPGSNADSIRIADMITRNIDDINQIIVSLDTHHPAHIAHAAFWKAGSNNKDKFAVPKEFSVIEHSDIKNDIWVPKENNAAMNEWVKYYTRELRRKGKQKLTIWPQHCLIGSMGHAVVKPINDALQEWATRRQRQVKYVLKGENLRTEMYSALVAEVVDEKDPRTAMDWDLLAELMIADKILICGQALRCVMRYVIDIYSLSYIYFIRLNILIYTYSFISSFITVIACSIRWKISSSIGRAIIRSFTY